MGHKGMMVLLHVTKSTYLLELICDYPLKYLSHILQVMSV